MDSGCIATLESDMSNERFAPEVDRNARRHILGAPTAALIDTIARHSHSVGHSLFMVGGVVRDLILQLTNHDLDFVLEDDAIAFADALAARFGGSVLAHRAFETAVWTLDERAAESLGLPLHEIPHHIDFARARSETYRRPAALPNVRNADIKCDLRRRDFTLNTLAIQLSPPASDGRLVDECGGLDDLRSRIVRVLHERSFIDDPTRILRSVRLSTRLNFAIESDTEALLRAALPLLGQVTGPRLVNEIELSLAERRAGDIFLRLQDLGALEHIHPAFLVNANLPDVLARLRHTDAPWSVNADLTAVKWCLLLAAVDENEVEAICQRLDLSRSLTRSIAACARITGATEMLGDAASPPSEAARLLDGLPEPALEAAWLHLGGQLVAQDKLANYIRKWRVQKASISGHDLERMGVPPGPSYQQILDALRFAWIDGQVNSPEDEACLLRELLSTYV